MTEESEKKIILSLCGGSGSWEKYYNENGYTTYNITLPYYDVNQVLFYENHMIFKSTALYNIDLKIYYKDIYGILAAPPCTMFSFARTNAIRPRKLMEGMENVIACMDIIWQCQFKITNQHQKKGALKFWALENPNAMLEWFLGIPPLIFDPYEYAEVENELYKKKPSIWGVFNIPEKNKMNDATYGKFDKLTMDDLKKIRTIHENDLWKNPSNRHALRSMTPTGFAKAFYESNK